MSGRLYRARYLTGRPGVSTVDDDALVAVCRTTYRLILAQGGTFADAKDAVRAELRRAGFDVAAYSDDMTSGMQTVVVMLADGRYVQRDVRDGWSAHPNSRGRSVANERQHVGPR